MAPEVCLMREPCVCHKASAPDQPQAFFQLGLYRRLTLLPDICPLGKPLCIWLEASAFD